MATWVVVSYCLHPAFSHGRINILDRILDINLPKNNVIDGDDWKLNTTVTLPIDTDPDDKLIHMLLAWFWRNYDKFPQDLKLDC